MSKRKYKLYIRYDIHPESKAVVAYVTGCDNMAIDQITKNLRNIGYKTNSIILFNEFLLESFDFLKMNSMYKTVAVARGDDEFDPEIGKFIAKKKMYAKLDAIISKKLFYFFEKMNKITIDSINLSEQFKCLSGNLDTDQLYRELVEKYSDLE